MARIYSGCIYVIAWLGLSSSRAARRYSKIRNAANTKAILENRYFTRLWIVQEVLLPKEARILCGDTWIHWDTLKQAALWADYLEHPTLRQVTWLLTNRYAHSEHIEPGYKHLLVNMLSQFSGMGCEDPRDKLYGMLGLVSEELRPVVNYDNTVEQVYLDTMRMLGVWHCLHASNWWWQDLPLRMGVSLAHVVSMQPFITDLLACGRQPIETLPFWTLHMGYEKADSKYHGLGRWWYECGASGIITIVLWERLKTQKPFCGRYLMLLLNEAHGNAGVPRSVAYLPRKFTQLQISRPATSGAILPSIPCCRGSVFNAMDDITIAKPTRSHD